MILDAAPAHTTETGGTGAADIDGDGKTELIIAGNGALLWYRPSTSERGVVARGYFNVGMALEDIDHDGHKEIVIGKKLEGSWGLCWYKFGATLHDPWKEYILDPACTGDPHDVVFGDLDGDGEQEMVANAMYVGSSGALCVQDSSRPNSALEEASRAVRPGARKAQRRAIWMGMAKPKSYPAPIGIPPRVRVLFPASYGRRIRSRLTTASIAALP